MVVLFKGKLKEGDKLHWFEYYAQRNPLVSVVLEESTKQPGELPEDNHSFLPPALLSIGRMSFK